jgi:hypothetical protein
MRDNEMKKIVISCGDLSVNAELNTSPTAVKIWDALPIEGMANTWGDEIYFGISVVAEGESDARADVAVGELGYWPPGRAFCIFFGPTPTSTGDEPRAASPVNIIGMVTEDATQFKSVRDGEIVSISKAGDE